MAAAAGAVLLLAGGPHHDGDPRPRRARGTRAASWLHRRPPHRHRATLLLGDRGRSERAARHVRDRRPTRVRQLCPRHRLLPGAQAAAVERRAHRDRAARTPRGRAYGARGRRPSAAGRVPAAHPVRGARGRDRARGGRRHGVRANGDRPVSQPLARSRVAGDRHESNRQAAGPRGACARRVRPEAGGRAPGAGAGPGGLPAVDPLPPRRRRRPPADRPALAGGGPGSRSWPRTCGRVGAAGRQRAARRRAVGRESRRAPGVARGHDPLAPVAGAGRCGGDARGVARHAGACGHRPDLTMTHTTTVRPGRELDALLQSGVIAVIRVPEAVRLRSVARALAAGGVGAVEVTLTTPGAMDAIADLAADTGLAGCVVGARIVVSPALIPAVMRACRERDVPCMPGAFTPTELLEAWRAGAPLVKLFPAAAVGPGFMRDVLAPLPFLRLVPSGGVTLENAGEWIRAGAAAVSVGSALVSAALLGPDGAAELTGRARAFVARVAEARA